MRAPLALLAFASTLIMCMRLDNSEAAPVTNLDERITPALALDRMRNRWLAGH